MVDVVILAIHHEDKIHAFLGCQESLSIVLSDPLLHVVVNQDLLVVSLIVLLVSKRFNGCLLVLAAVQIDFCSELFESQLN